MPKRYFVTSIYIRIYIVFNQQMLQGPSNDLFNPLVPEAQKSACQNLPFPLQMKPN